MLRGQGKGVCSLSSPVRESLLQALRADVASRLQWTRASRGSGPGAGAGGGRGERAAMRGPGALGRGQVLVRLPAALNLGKVLK